MSVNRMFCESKVFTFITKQKYRKRKNCMHFNVNGACVCVVHDGDVDDVLDRESDYDANATYTGCL